MIWNLSPREQSGIVTAVFEAAQIAFRNPSVSEPQLIANLVKQLPDHLNSIALDYGRKINVGGVFIHQKPFAACADFPEPRPKSVELGDLLLIRTAMSRQVVVERRALLLQAKKVGKLPTNPDNENQHYLYSYWPTFAYKNSGPTLNGKRRHVRGPGLYSGAKYFLIGSNPTAIGCLANHILPHTALLSCGLSTAEPSSPNLSAYECFYKEMVNFIAGNAGRTYLSPPPKCTRGWHRLIDDLLQRAVAKKSSVYTRKAGVAEGQRGYMIDFIAGNIDSSRGALGTIRVSSGDNEQEPPDVSDDIAQDDESGGGVSVIEFFVTDDEWREPQ